MTPGAIGTDASHPTPTPGHNAWESEGQRLWDTSGSLNWLGSRARGPETVEEAPDGAPPGLSRMPLERAESSPAVASPNWPGEARRRSSLSLAPNLGNGFGVQGCESLARH